MKITAFFHGILMGDKIVLKVNDEKDFLNVKKLFHSKAERENRSQKEILLKCKIDAAFQSRSFKQVNAVWKLIDCIFEAENLRKPTEEERYDLYLDLLELYADKIPNRYNNQLRSIHISKANTMAAAHFISGLLYHLSSMCSLSNDLEATVRDVLYEWEIWRGKQEHDINDDMSVKELKERVIFSEASGRTPVHLHHIVSRGACPAAIEKAWNLIALTPEEHMFFHQQCKNYEDFLQVYPHLRGKINRAFEKCAELVQEKNSLGVNA